DQGCQSQGNHQHNAYEREGVGGMIGPVELPWPNRLLHPNARPHWAVKAKAAKSARRDAAWLVLAAIGTSKCWWKGVALNVEFCPPDNRRRDLDGLIASMKAAQDAISDAPG